MQRPERVVARIARFERRLPAAAPLPAAPTAGLSGREERAERRDADECGKPRNSACGFKYEIAHLKLVPKRHIGRMIAAGIVLLLFVGLVRASASGRIEWSYVRDFLFAPANPRRPLTTPC